VNSAFICVDNISEFELPITTTELCIHLRYMHGALFKCMQGTSDEIERCRIQIKQGR